MDKTVAGLIGAVTTLAAAAPSQAKTPALVTADAVMGVGSYADLLKPIPNALALLKEVLAAEGSVKEAAEKSATVSEGDARVLEAQYYPPYYHHHHHHHHHHHRYFHRRYYHHHHHHHHHHHGYYGERFIGYPQYST